MTTHPLYLPAALIPAFVSGRVTMLIEPLKVQPVRMMADGRDLGEYVMKSIIDLPHAPGDRLWLREAYWTCEECGYVNPCLNANSAGVGNAKCCASCDEILPERIHTPVTMPKRFSRAWAEVVSVDVKRVQDVTFAESQSAGFGDMRYVSPLDAFRAHFTATHGPDAWDRNPLCTFTTIEPHAGNVEGEGC